MYRNKDQEKEKKNLVSCLICAPLCPPPPLTASRETPGSPSEWASSGPGWTFLPGVRGYLPRLCPTARLHDLHCPASTLRPQGQIPDSSGQQGPDQCARCPRPTSRIPGTIPLTRAVGAEAPGPRPSAPNRRSSVHMNTSR